MGKNKALVVSFLLLSFVLVAGGSLVWGKTGTLELIGIPEDVSPGRYDTKTGLFQVDVTDLEDAFVKIIFEDMEIVGKKLEWHTKDDYFIFTGGARLEKEDFTVTSDILEYFGEEEKLVAEGDVEVITDDATVQSQSMVYDEEADEALFTDQVVVIFDDGTLEGEKFLMNVGESELTFYGIFQGVFESDSNK